MKYRREIDGLRALAVLPVVFYHAGFSAFKGGFVGVDIFFVISGYLITSILIAEKSTGTYSILNFYERRARRILPALYFMMLVSTVAAWVWLLPAYMESFCRSLIAVPLFASNFLFSLRHGYFEVGAELKPLLHTWSLAVEEQYYMLFPVLLTLVWKFPKKWIITLLALIAIGSISLAQIGIFVFPSQTYFLLPTRAWEILLGALLSFVNYKEDIKDGGSSFTYQLLSATGLLMILSAIHFFDEKTPIPGLFALIPTVGAVLIIQFASSNTFVGRMLGSRILVGIGLISYSIYLWHQPFFAFARHVNVSDPSSAVYVGVVGLSILAGYLSWRFVEQPFRSKVLASRQLVFLFSIVGAAVFVSIGIAGHLTHGFPSRYSSQIQSVLAIPEVSRLFIEDGCQLQDKESALHKCVRGNKSVKPQFALVGDSHASSLIHELELAFETHDMSFVQYTKNGCPFLVGLKKLPVDNCDVFQDAYVEDFKSSGVNTYIISSRWPVYVSEHHFDNLEGGIERKEVEQYTTGNIGFDQPFSERRAALLIGLRKSLVDLLDIGKNVVLVYPVPEQGWDVSIRHAKILMLNGKLDSDISVSAQRYRERNADVLKIFDDLGQRPNLIRVHPEQIFCDSYVVGRCLATYGGQQFYFDDNHLSNAGARLVVDQILSAAMKFEKHVGEIKSPKIAK